MAEPALKMDDEFIRMRRVTRPDLMDKGQWLCKRLKENWPHLQDRQLMGWLITCCDSNEHLFIRTDKAFLLAQLQKEFVEPYPWVKEMFVLAELDNGTYPKDSDGAVYQAQENGRSIRQAASLYQDLLRWAEKMCANEIIVDKFTDVPLEDKENKDNPYTIRKMVNQRLFKGEEIFFRIDPERVRKI